MKFKYNKEDHTLSVVEATRLEHNQLKLWLTREVDGAMWLPDVKKGFWDGKVHLFNNGRIRAGLWKECVKSCQLVGSNFEMENKADFPIDRQITYEDMENFVTEFFKDHKYKKSDGTLVPFTPRDYQIDTAFKILKNKYCLAQVATSGGKSLILSSIFFYYLSKVNPNGKILLIVPSINLVTQFYDDIYDYNQGFEKENKNPLPITIDEVMSDSPRKARNGGANITIACYQSIAGTMVKDKKPKDFKGRTEPAVEVCNYPKEWFEQFDMIAIDEAHICKATSLERVLKKTMGTTSYRFGVSGTFTKQEMGGFYTIQSLTGPIVNDIKAKKLIEDGTITPLKVFQYHVNHNNPRYDELLKNIRKNINNAKKAYDMESKYIQESEPRLKFISQVLKNINGNTLVLFNNIEYGKAMMEYCRPLFPDYEFHFISGEVKNKDRGVIKLDMENTDKIRVLFATYGTLSTGVSINAISYVLFTQSFKSEVRIIQSIGRALRKHSDKDLAKIIDIVDCFTDKDPTNAFFRHGDERVSMYKKHGYPYVIKKFTLVKYDDAV